jgi:nucleoid DNA-binding protein
MTLTKKQMVREIGRRTRLKNRYVQMMLETLIEVWTEELVEGSGRIELEGLFVLESRQVDRGECTGHLRSGKAPRYIRRVGMRVSHSLRQQLRLTTDESSTHPFQDHDG